MEIVRTVAALRSHVEDWRAKGHTSAVIPTMGGLHEGHLSLVRHGRDIADRTVATLFVNPTQFAPTEDLDAYPRDEAGDAAMLEGAGCDLLFAPPVSEMYPPDFSTRVIVDGLTDCLCGAVRSGHFDGVAQVVTKLLNQARCDIAMFGEKDWQQVAVVTRLSRDLDIGTRIVGARTIRETDGLAMSSRNRYLTAPERDIAGRLPALLLRTAKAVAQGASAPGACKACAQDLLAAGFESVDYIEVRTALTLEPVDKIDPATPARIFAAAHLGKARLIDNMAIEPAAV